MKVTENKIIQNILQQIGDTQNVVEFVYSHEKQSFTIRLKNSKEIVLKGEEMQIAKHYFIGVDVSITFKS